MHILERPHPILSSDCLGIYVVRAFVQLRELLTSNKELARQFANLEGRLNKKLTEHDDAIAAILSAIRQLMNPPAPKRRHWLHREAITNKRPTTNATELSV
jgi:hypothetical protein